MYVPDPYVVVHENIEEVIVLVDVGEVEVVEGGVDELLLVVVTWEDEDDEGEDDDEVVVVVTKGEDAEVVTTVEVVGVDVLLLPEVNAR